MSLPVDINYITAEQSYLIDDMARFTEYLQNYEEMSMFEIWEAIKNIKTDNENFNQFKNLVEEFIYKGLGSIKIWHVEHDPLTGFDAFMFTDDYGNSGFSFGPTDGLRDLISDGFILLDTASIQYINALNFFNDYRDKISGSNKNFLFGYSLGGNLALFVYKNYSDFISKVYVFNALPVKDWTMTDEDKTKINQWVKDGDRVHKIGIFRADHSNEDMFTGKDIQNDAGIAGVFGDHTRKIGSWFDASGNPVGGYPSLIEVDTWKLRDYGMRLEKVQQRVYDLQNKIRDYNNPFSSLDTTLLKLTNNLINQFMQIFSDLEKAFNNYSDDFNLGKYCSYLFWTSDELENIERTLSCDLANMN